MYHGKLDVIMTFALNSALWEAAIGLLIYAITSRFQKTQRLTNCHNHHAIRPCYSNTPQPLPE